MSLNVNNIDSAVARLFSGQALKKVLSDDRPKIVEEVSAYLSMHGLLGEDSTLGDLLKASYEYLSRNYRNEYIYKNAIANKILLGVHSINTSYMLQEFRVGRSKVDTVILNGTSNVYEIKSELDTLERLERQISDYKRAFDKVHVITSEDQLKKSSSLP